MRTDGDNASAISSPITLLHRDYFLKETGTYVITISAIHR